VSEAARDVRIEPFDEFNRELVGNVHPPGWKNPEPKPRYHLVVIGAGTGGLVTAAGAAGLGARVALIERHLMGGDCLNVGCVPSKGVIRAARAWSEARRANERFGGPMASGEADFGAAMQRMRRLRAGLSPVDSAERFRGLGVDVFLGHGRFADRDTIEVDGARLQFRRAVIATGARAAAPPIPGLDEAGYRNNETIFSLTELPERLVVIGAGPIGCELAQSFARFGSRVTILDQADHVLPREDADAARIVEAALVRDGVEYVSRARIHRVERSEAGRVVHFERDGVETRVAADEILVAVGRAPNVEGLGLEAAGVDYSRSGVAVDARLRTTHKRVFAVGDICSRYKFTHAADAQARLVIANALFFGLGGGRGDRLVVPWCTYTSPEVAHVGLYEQEAVAEGYAVDTLTVPLSDLDRAVLDGESEGFLRVHLQKGKDKILGATLVAEHAGEMISELTLAMSSGLGLSKVGAAIHPYPTQAEVFRKAADARRRASLTPAVKRIFELVFRILR
jgi:pyruvate/2-oxoglutarate dehydrogenase complex dihydrolipoamide dehydrogenase (E3) component